MTKRENRVARVAADVSLDRLFDYSVPEELREKICVGMQVRIPFGRRMTCGYVVDLADSSLFEKLKSVAEIVGDAPFISEALLKLSRWMALYYAAPLEQALRTVLPAAVRNNGVRFLRQLYVAPLGSETDESTLTSRQTEVLQLLRAHGGGLLSEVKRALKVSPATLRKLEQHGALSITEEVRGRRPLARFKMVPTTPLSLMDEQAVAVKAISAALHEKHSKPFLLYGVTGSGKTEVYLQTIAEALKQNRQAIVLVPEIALTPQTVNRFVARFGEKVAVLHSRLSDGERHDEWHRIRDGDADVVIGPRSAVFAPLPRLGLIVVDEEHEPSYKQEEQPRYHARDVAVMRGYFEGCGVVLGSATPALESWHNACEGKYGLLTLPRRADNRDLPLVHIVDMRHEKERTGHAAAFSRELISAMHQRLDCGEQIILFLNRRGYSSSLVCKHCGFVAGCENCSVSYTYHRSDELLRCHICGDGRKVPDRCPSCQDPTFKFAGVGTQRIETILEKLFPRARVKRMDADTTTAKHSHDEILGAFRSGQVDILVGTQMIAKGLHFPNVTLVGVLQADMSLYIPDFRAGERTFQLLAQVSGRAGRGEVPGEVYIQTYTPFHPAVQASRNVNFEGFAKEELEFRQELSYPPFTRLVCVLIRGKVEREVSAAAARIAGSLSRLISADVIASEPTPAPLARAKGDYRYQIILRSVRGSSMVKPLRAVLGTLKLPRGVRVSIDVDAYSLM